jgi:hypothetical protein
VNSSRPSGIRRAVMLFAIPLLVTVVVVPSVAGAGLPLSASPRHVNFGAFPVDNGYTATMTVTLTNTSNATVTGTSISCSGDCAEFVNTAGDCINAISPNATCTATYEFGPNGSTGLGHDSATYSLLAGTVPVGKWTLSGRGT